jgi:hypothetical protein
MPGLLGFLGQFSTSQVVREYGVASVPQTFLIGPDGAILLRNRHNPTRLWMTQFKEEVGKALGRN